MSTIYGNALILPSKGGESGGASGETTSLQVLTSSGDIEAPLFCIWQTSNGRMGTANFDTSESFTLSNVIIGGYVIFTHDPNSSWYFSTSNRNGIEDIGVEAMDEKWDLPDAALVMKVTAPLPQFIIRLLNQ